MLKTLGDYMFSRKSVFQHNNVTRMIMNHAPIGEYRLRFFPNKSFACPCDDYPIEMRVHILHGCA